MPATFAPDRRVLIVPGLAMPFFPARPSAGAPLASPRQAVARIAREFDCGRIVQRKLNGDRCCLGVAGGCVLAQNRHGSWLSQFVTNGSQFAFMGDGSCLDGEIMPGGVFRPFECLAWGGASLLREPASVRIQAAKLVCAHLGARWDYDVVEKGRTFDHSVMTLRAHAPRVEGVVSKADGPYPVGHSASAETPAWRKLKWLS